MIDEGEEEGEGEGEVGEEGERELWAEDEQLRGNLEGEGEREREKVQEQMSCILRVIDDGMKTGQMKVRTHMPPLPPTHQTLHVRVYKLFTFIKVNVYTQ